MPYKFIDHTADIAVEVTGKDLNELFIESANAWRSAVAENYEVKAGNKKEINLTESKKEILLVTFLDELNFLLYTKKWLMDKIISLQIENYKNNYQLKSVIEGDYFDTKVVLLKEEIKAVTYHNLEISESVYGYNVTIVFDI